MVIASCIWDRQVYVRPRGKGEESTKVQWRTPQRTEFQTLPHCPLPLSLYLSRHLNPSSQNKETEDWQRRPPKKQDEELQSVRKTTGQFICFILKGVELYSPSDPIDGTYTEWEITRFSYACYECTYNKSQKKSIQLVEAYCTRYDVLTVKRFMKESIIAWYQNIISR